MGLRKWLDGLGKKVPHDSKGYALYEAADTFLYTPDSVTKGASHVRDGLDLKRMMITVVWALLPCILMAMYNTGLQANTLISVGGVDAADNWRSDLMAWMGLGFDPDSLFSCFFHGFLYFFPIFLVTQLAGGFWEVLFSTVRGHEINEGFLVTGMLFPLTLPPTIPLWQVAIGISFGVVIGKEVFGGTGKNFLNPALTGRAFLYFAYPAQITGELWAPAHADATSGPTILGACQAGGMDAVTGDSGLGVTWMEAFLGDIQGSMGETSTLACLIGAAFLILTGIGSWRIMAAVLVSALGCAALLNWAGEGSQNKMFEMSPMWHLVSGGLAFGLVFMATDPVSAAMTDAGKWIYGALIGVMTVLVRVVNPAFPEGVMLAILFGNVFAPLIDYMVVKSTIKRRMARSVQKQG